jgi:hypothetical protein
MNRKHNPWVSLVALLLLVTLLVAICTGCTISSTKTEYDDPDDAPKMMTVVDSTLGYAIYRHDETGVHYFCRDGGYGRSVCVMVNADGTPYTGSAEG